MKRCKILSIEEIIKQTKLDYNCIQQTIQKRQHNNSKNIKQQMQIMIFINANKNII